MNTVKDGLNNLKRNKMNNNLEFENEYPSPDSIEDNHPRTNYGEGFGNQINLPKQETLEEAAHEMLVDYGIKSIGQSIGVPTVKKLMVNMAKWQAERMYSKEDLKEVYFSAIKSTGEGRNGECASGNSPVDIKKEFTEEFEEWFEQFKKK